MAESSSTDIELGRLNADPAYFQEVNELGVLLGNTADIVKKLKKANQEFNSATEFAAMKEIKGCMEKDMAELEKMAHIMKEKLGEIVENSIKNRKNRVCEMSMATHISRMSLTVALKTKLEEIKSDLQNLEKTIRQEYLEVIQRRTFTATGIKLSDEVISVIDTGSLVQMFENALQGTSPEQIAAAVDEIKERHATASDFGKKILEVQQVFVRMVALIGVGESLDKLLDGFQKNATRAKSTEEELRAEKAKNDQLSALLAAIIVVVFFLLIL